MGALALFNEKWVTLEARNPFILRGCGGWI
jgi:hypothetical protein